MDRTTNPHGDATTGQGPIARWLRPASLTPAEADALRGYFPPAAGARQQTPAGLTPAEAAALAASL